MSFYGQLEIERLREKNAAMLRELGKMRAERDEALVELAKTRAERDEAVDELAVARAAFDAMAMVQTATANVASQAFDERDAARARAADSDARLVRAIDAAKTAALAVLEGEELDFDCDGMRHYVADDSEFLGACDCRDDGLDCGDGLDTARKGRTTPSVRR